MNLGVFCVHFLACEPQNILACSFNHVIQSFRSLCYSNIWVTLGSTSMDCLSPESWLEFLGSLEHIVDILSVILGDLSSC